MTRPRHKAPRKVVLTASMIRAYKSCPRLYELQYIHMLRPERENEALTTGRSYHSLIEGLLNGQPLDTTQGVASAMAHAFNRFIPWRDWGIVETEHEFNVKFSPYFLLRGKIDALCEDGCIVEHKTTRNALDDLYLERLALDDQVSVYLAAQSLATQKLVTRVHYTAVQKPTIRMKQGETEEMFLNRVGEWYTPDKVKSFTVVRTPSQIQDAIDELKALAREIRNRKLWYRNPAHCSIVDCAYRSICLDCDPQTLTGFVKKTNNNEELSPCKF